MKVLIVVDMQKDFIDGALGSKAAQAIVQNVKSKIEERRASGYNIIFTRDTHGEDYLNTQEGRKLPVPHCIKGSEGWQIISELDVKPEDVIFDKPTFGSLKLADYLATINPGKVEFIGVCTDICVISNAMVTKAKLPEAELWVDASCCAGVTPESHNNALKAMECCHINILS